MAARNAKPSVLSLSSVNLSILGNESWAWKFPVYMRWSSWFAFRPGLAYSLFPHRTIFVVYIRESGLVHFPRSPLEQPMGSRQGSSPTTHKHNENVLRYVTGDFFNNPAYLTKISQLLDCPFCLLTINSTIRFEQYDKTREKYEGG